MQAISTKALSSPAVSSGLSSKGRRSSRQPSRPVIASAAKGNEPERSEEQGPNKYVMSAVGAIAAVQLALGGPVFAQDPLPSSAESQSARDEVNRETSNAPSFLDIGKNFSQNVLGGGGDAGEKAKDAAESAASKAQNAAPDLSSSDPLPDSAESQSARDKVNAETSNAPGLLDIGKNFSQNVLGGGGGSDIAQAGKEAANKAKNATPDLSDNNSFDRALKQGIFDRASTNVGKVFNEAGSATKPFPDSITNLGKDQSVLREPRKAKQVTAQTASSATEGVKKGADSAKAGAKSAASKAKNAADISQLPDIGGLLNKAQGKVSGDIDATKGKVQGDIGTAKGKVKSDIGTTKGKVKSDIGTAKNAAGDLSQLPDVGGVFEKAKGKVSGDIDATKGKVQGDIGTAKGKVKSDIGTTKGKVKSDIGTAKNAAGDLSQLPDVGGLVEKAKGKVSGDIDVTKGKVNSDIGTTKGKVKSDIGTTAGKVKSDIGTAKNAAPDLSTAQLPDGNQLFKRLQGRENTFDALQRAADKAGSQAKKVTSDIGSKGSTAGAKAQNVASTAGGKAKSAASKAKNAADLSFNPLDIIGKEPQNAAEDAQKAASELQSVGGQQFKQGGGKPKQQEGKDLKKDYGQGSSDLPVPDVGGDVDVSGETAKQN